MGQLRLQVLKDVSVPWQLRLRRCQALLHVARSFRDQGHESQAEARKWPASHGTVGLWDGIVSSTSYCRYLLFLRPLIGDVVDL